MTPEERQMLGALSDRIKSAPSQEIDAEADQALRQLAQIRPDALYLLAQTTLMQDFALRNAQAQIAELQRQAQRQSAPAPQSSGSFLGGLFGGNQAPPPASVPAVNPWGRPVQPQPQAYAPPPQQPAYGYAPAPGAPIMQPAQTSGFLRSAATTAAGIAGGALLFEGIQSLFSGHQGFGGMGGGFMNPTGFGGMGGSYGGQPSLSETTINNYYDGQSPGAAPDQQAADYQPDQTDAGSYQDADYQDNSGGGDFSSDDSGGGSDSV